MSALKWQDPPPTNSGPGKTNWLEVTAALRARPGEWALVLEGVTNSNAAVQRKRFPGFEFTSRCIDGPTCANIYARYVGGVS